MNFSSLIFTFLFLPIAFIIYHLSKDKYQNTNYELVQKSFIEEYEPDAVILIWYPRHLESKFGRFAGNTDTE